MSCDPSLVLGLLWFGRGRGFFWIDPFDNEETHVLLPTRLRVTGPVVTEYGQ